MEDDTEAVALVRDWAAHNGLRANMEYDPTIDPQFDPTFLNVTSDPYPDSMGIQMARPTIVTLHRRYLLRAGSGWERLPGYEFIEVHLVRHGRTRAPIVVSPEELSRFGLEARHLDRID